MIIAVYIVSFIVVEAHLLVKIFLKLSSNLFPSPMMEGIPKMVSLPGVIIDPRYTKRELPPQHCRHIWIIFC